jgi:hypothetical protein
MRAWLPTLLLVAVACARMPEPVADGVPRVDGRSAEA